MLCFVVPLVLGIFPYYIFASPLLDEHLIAQNKFPYQCSLYHLYEDYPLCHCNIINEFQVITTADCVEKTNILDGSTKIRARNCFNYFNRCLHNITTFRIHPHRKGILNNIAVITIKDPFIIDEFPSLSTAPIVNLSQCFSFRGSPEFTYTVLYNYMLSKKSLCVVEPNSNLEGGHPCLTSIHRTMRYDSEQGSPLVCNGQLAGIATGYSSKITRTPIYIDIYYYLEFIRQARADICIY